MPCFDSFIIKEAHRTQASEIAENNLFALLNL
jgi:hypothetical protein